MNKASRGNFFEDFVVGQKLVHAVPHTITEGNTALYISLTIDRHPLFCDAEFARGLGFQRELVHDLLVFHTVFGKSVSDISLNAVANLGYADLRFLQPVYVGDTLRAESEVIGKRENSNGKSGIVYVQTKGYNQNDEQVLQFYRWVMVHKSDTSTPTGDNQVPDLPAVVSADQLVVPDQLDLSGFDASRTGGRWGFEDYRVGERIHHLVGMTIEDSDHMSATRLYQNTAKPHFDLHLVRQTGGERRLVYGGHIISLAYSHAFNGLENALHLLAWNSGTHSNPSYAGDTIYAFSDVLDAAELPGRNDLGALRLRMVGVKNHNPAESDIDIEIEQNGKSKYHPNVVLDLDYWVAVPKKSVIGG
ncbi:MAG: MaoC family dehydratase [Gammaproteobacteria bacterium]|nr:MaoC family dehydratase [Gammaproteobacteria bacterium]